MFGKTPPPNNDFALIVNGVLDVLFAFAVSLERKGLMERAEIAGMLREVRDQVTKQQGGPTRRSLPAEYMLQGLDMPVAGAQARERFQVIDGDREPEPTDRG